MNKTIIIGKNIKSGVVIDNQNEILKLSNNNCQLFAVTNIESNDCNFRSNIANQFALDIISRRIFGFLLFIETNKKPPTEKELQYQKEQFYLEWKEQIKKHLDNNPITINASAKHVIKFSKQDSLEEKKYFVTGASNLSSELYSQDITSKNYQELKNDPYIIYGTSLFCFGFCSFGVFVMKIGKGNISVYTINDNIDAKKPNDSKKMLTQDNFVSFGCLKQKDEFFFKNDLVSLISFSFDENNINTSIDENREKIGFSLYSIYYNLDGITDVENLSIALENLINDVKFDNCKLYYLLNK